jgi:hypothetical protein
MGTVMARTVVSLIFATTVPLPYTEAAAETRSRLLPWKYRITTRLILGYPASKIRRLPSPT